jgi:hypothetical protein
MSITYREPTVNPGDKIVSVTFVDTATGKTLKRDIHVVYDILGEFDTIGTHLRIKRHLSQLEEQARVIGTAAFNAVAKR